MEFLKRSKSKTRPARSAQGLPRAIGHFPRALDQGVHEAASRVAEAAEAAQKQAGRKLAKAGALANSRQPVLPPAPTGLRSRIRFPPSRKLRLQIGSSTASEALLRAQLARTSRQLAHESTEIGEAVGSMKTTLRAERRKARVARRRRLGLNLVLGAAVMFFLDPKSGRGRRRFTSRWLKRLVSALKSVNRGLQRLLGGPSQAPDRT